MIPIGFVFIECEKSGEDAILQKIAGIAGVVYVYKLDKSYNIVVKIESDSAEQFAAAISQIRSIDGIVNTDTMVGFKP